MRIASSLHLVPVLALSCAARAQSPTWTVQTAWPPPLSSTSMAFDLVRGRSVMAAPVPGGGGRLETWEWDGVAWRVMRPAVVPLFVSTPAPAFDALRLCTVLFDFNTWEWDGVTWSQRFPVNAPSQRLNHRMAFDLNRSRTVLFGGSFFAGGGVSDETWEWDGVNWTQRLPATRPAARANPGMAHDLFRNRTVIFGGTNAQGNRLGDTWEWDGTNWTRMLPLHS